MLLVIGLCRHVGLAVRVLSAAAHNRPVPVLGAGLARLDFEAWGLLSLGRVILGARADRSRLDWNSVMNWSLLVLQLAFCCPLCMGEQAHLSLRCLQSVAKSLRNSNCQSMRDRLKRVKRIRYLQRRVVEYLMSCHLELNYSLQSSYCSSS